jgi:hypothetical protein
VILIFWTIDLLFWRENCGNVLFATFPCYSAYGRRVLITALIGRLLYRVFS